MSLAELTAWCEGRFPESATKVGSVPDPRAFDIPWMILDSRQAQDTWDWHPQTSIQQTCEEIATFAEAHPNWLEISAS